MESWENKIIKDKVDGLQQLPAGYSPDLSSKWEIIEAGLPGNRKRVTPLLVRWSVAAVIMACVILAGIKMNQNNTSQQGIMSSVKLSSLPMQIVIQKEQNAIAAQPVIIKNTEVQKALKSTPVSETSVATKQDKPAVVIDELKINPVIPAIDSATVATSELAMTIPQPETPRRAKRRTFQKDFNDGQLAMDTGYSKSANPQFSFKLQLHPPATDDHQPSRRLQLKQIL